MPGVGRFLTKVFLGRGRDRCTGILYVCAGSYRSGMIKCPWNRGRAGWHPLEVS